MTRTSKTVSRILLAAGVAVSALAGGVATAQAQQQARQYCFHTSNNTNVLAGDFGRGFHAYPLGRSGNSLWYQRVGGTNRYVGETGAIYTLFSNGSATWSDGSRMIRLYRCN